MNKKMLLITDVYFQNKLTGSENRIYNMIEFLKKQNIEITFFYIGNSDEVLINKNNMGIKTIFCDSKISIKNKLRSIIGKTFLWNVLKKLKKKKKLKKEITLPYNNDNIKFIEKHLKSNNYDFVLFEYIYSFYLLDSIKRESNAKTFIDTHDLMYQRYNNFKKFEIQTPLLKITKEEELQILSNFDKVIAIQYDEYKILESELGKEKLILSMHGMEDKIFESTKYKIRKDNLKIVFFGSAAKFNIDSVEWFLLNIWNEVSKLNFQFHIYGLICEYLENVPSSVTLNGRVDSINEVYENADIIINPIRFGSGLKIKNVEAMSFGVPLLTTSVGVEGMPNISDKEVLIADDISSFKESILKMKDIDLRLSLSKNSKKYSKNKFSQSECFKELKDNL